ncbi:probable leucine-rich repeat receptor-like serine/threonine-protein kinase at3g14840, partial [Phtheirospermum japonicum]
LEHEYLVKLYGCCTEGDQRILVYCYLENNSLAQTLLRRYSDLQFSWKMRTKICVGVAQGLAFLHDEIQPHIVHRDIKAINILLDKYFTPEISDFGLAKHVAGTFGYLAPEYAIRDKLTRKEDIYSFGVLLLEIVSGSATQTRDYQRKNKIFPKGHGHCMKRDANSVGGWII